MKRNRRKNNPFIISWAAVAVSLLALVCAGCATSSNEAAKNLTAHSDCISQSTSCCAPTPEAAGGLKERMHLLRPGMSSAEAEAVLGITTILDNRLRAICTGGAISESYTLRGGAKLFLWRQSTGGGLPCELVSVALSEVGQPDFKVWVKPEFLFNAELQTNLFSEIRIQALATIEPQVVTSLMAFALEDYPGTRQIAGSSLDQVVRENRRNTIATMVAHLKNITAVDLGDSPQPWIERYGL